MGDERFVSKYPSWFWDESNANRNIVFDKEKKIVTFFPNSSNGTLSVVGDTPFLQGYIYYWEVKILSKIGGTDTMIGVGKKEASKSSSEFESLLGKDTNSWGFSYKGRTWYDDAYGEYMCGFNTNDRVGCLCDLGKGILEFFKNGTALGVAFRNALAPELYPMFSTSNAKTSIQLLEMHQVKSGLWSDAFQALAWYTKGRQKIESIPAFKDYPKQYWFLGERSPMSPMHYDDEDGYGTSQPNGVKFWYVNKKSRSPTPPH